MKTNYGRLILPDGKYYSLDDRATRINNNVCICGTSGTSKTRNVVIPNLLECTGSYIVTDPKGSLHKKYGKYMEEHGYKVLKLSFIHPKESVRYNPLRYTNTSQEIQKLAYSFVYADKLANSSKDPFWDETALFLINSAIGYLVERRFEEPEKCNLCEAVNNLRYAGEKSLCDARSRNSVIPSAPSDRMSVFSLMMKCHEAEYPNSWAARQLRNIISSPDKTFNTIVTSALSKFSALDTDELHEMLSGDELDIISIGKEKTVLFVEVSDTDRSMDLLINTFFTQAMNQLCSYADEKCETFELPVPVRFIMDDFATNCKIDKFENMISNIRSRKISAMIVVQSLSQLSQGYGEAGAVTILDNCDTMVFMGTNSPETAQSIAERCNKMMQTVLNMPLNTSWIFRRGEKPKFVQNVDAQEVINSYLNDEVDREEDIEEIDL